MKKLFFIVLMTMFSLTAFAETQAELAAQFDYTCKVKDVFSQTVIGFKADCQDRITEEVIYYVDNGVQLPISYYSKEPTTLRLPIGWSIIEPFFTEVVLKLNPQLLDYYRDTEKNNPYDYTGTNSVGEAKEYSNQPANECNENDFVPIAGVYIFDESVYPLAEWHQFNIQLTIDIHDRQDSQARPFVDSYFKTYAILDRVYSANHILCISYSNSYAARAGDEGFIAVYEDLGIEAGVYERTYTLPLKTELLP